MYDSSCILLLYKQRNLVDTLCFEATSVILNVQNRNHWHSYLLQLRGAVMLEHRRENTQKGHSTRVRTLDGCSCASSKGGRTGHTTHHIAESN